MSLATIPGLTATTMPSMDISETDKAIEITAELPGLEKKDVELNVADNLRPHPALPPGPNFLPGTGSRLTGQPWRTGSARLAAHVFASTKLFADDTPIPVLDPGRGRTKTGRRPIADLK